MKYPTFRRILAAFDNTISGVLMVLGSFMAACVLIVALSEISEERRKKAAPKPEPVVIRTNTHATVVTWTSATNGKPIMVEVDGKTFIPN